LRKNRPDLHESHFDFVHNNVTYSHTPTLAHTHVPSSMSHTSHTSSMSLPGKFDEQYSPGSFCVESMIPSRGRLPLVPLQELLPWIPLKKDKLKLTATVGIETKTNVKEPPKVFPVNANLNVTIEHTEEKSLMSSLKSTLLFPIKTLVSNIPIPRSNPVVIPVTNAVPKYLNNPFSENITSKDSTFNYEFDENSDSETDLEHTKCDKYKNNPF